MLVALRSGSQRTKISRDLGAAELKKEQRLQELEEHLENIVLVQLITGSLS